MIATVGHRYASEGFSCPGRGYAAALRCRHRKAGAASETPYANFANLAQTAEASVSAGPSICTDSYLDVSGWNVILWMRLLTKILHNRLSGCYLGSGSSIRAQPRQRTTVP
jgi:hypothetical protein